MQEADKLVHMEPRGAMKKKTKQRTGSKSEHRKGRGRKKMLEKENIEGREMALARQSRGNGYYEDDEERSPEDHFTAIKATVFDMGPLLKYRVTF